MRKEIDKTVKQEINKIVKTDVFRMEFFNS